MASTTGRGGGSSPLTRGAPGAGGRWPVRIGLIPAHAGSTREDTGHQRP